MRKQLILALILLTCSFSAAACKSKVDDAPKADVQQPAEKPAEETPKQQEERAAKEAESHTVPINTPTSKIEFIGANPVEDHRGGFSKWEGTATLSPTNELQKIEFKIDMSTVYTNEDEVDLDAYKQNDSSEKPIVQTKLDRHLMDPDFFDVPKFPNSTFVSSKIVPGGDNGATHTVTGDLTLHGVTKTITFPAKVSVTDGVVSASADFSINRFDFGIKYEGRKDNLIKKEVRLMINLSFPATQG